MSLNIGGGYTTTPVTVLPGVVFRTLTGNSHGITAVNTGIAANINVNSTPSLSSESKLPQVNTNTVIRVEKPGGPPSLPPSLNLQALGANAASDKKVFPGRPGVTLSSPLHTVSQGSEDPVVVQGQNFYFVDAVNGSDSYNGLHGSFKGGTDGPWKTPNKAEASLPSTAQGLYWKSGVNPGDRFKMPSSFSVEPTSGRFQFDTYYLDPLNVPRKYTTASYTQMADWNQGIIEPERQLFASYVGTSDDHPSTVRRWSSSRYTAAISFQDRSNIEVRNQRVRNVEGYGIEFDNTGSSYLVRFQNPNENNVAYNNHVEHACGEGIFYRFVNDFRVEHNYVSDVGRDHFINNINTVPVPFIGCKRGIVKNNDVLLNYGEGIDVLKASSDIAVYDNWLYGNDSVNIFIDTAHEIAIFRNMCMMAPDSETRHLRSTWTKDSLGGSTDSFRGEGWIYANEGPSLGSSWVETSDVTANIVAISNISLGNSDGFRTSVGAAGSNSSGGVRTSPDDAGDYENLHCYNCLMIANTQNVEKGSLAGVTDNYVNNRFMNNILLDGGETVDEIGGTSQGVVASNNMREQGIDGGNWSGPGDLIGASNVTINKNSGYRNLVPTSGSITDQKYWGWIRDGRFVAIADITPQAGSNTIGAGTALAALQIPSGITQVSSSEMLRDFNGNPFNDPVDMGPFKA